MLLLDSGTLTRVMEMIHPPILLAQDWDNITVNSVMGAVFPLGFIMPATDIALIVQVTMITEVFLLEDQPVIIGWHQNEAIRVLSEKYLKVNLLGHFPAVIQKRTQTALSHRHLKIFRQNILEKGKGRNKVALSRSVRTNEHIDFPERNITVFDGFEAANRHAAQLVSL